MNSLNLKDYTFVNTFLDKSEKEKDSIIREHLFSVHHARVRKVLLICAFNTYLLNHFTENPISL